MKSFSLFLHFYNSYGKINPNYTTFSKGENAYVRFLQFRRF